MNSNKLYNEKNSWYLQNNPTWHVEDSEWKAIQILKMLNKNNISPELVIEIGCGAGEILNQLHKKLAISTRFIGYDISSDAIELAKQREQDRLIFKIEDFLQSNTTGELLLMIDVFEHIEDYFGFLRAAKPRAKYKIFHIPLDISLQSILKNRLLFHRKSVGHLHYFTKDTAIATLQDTGYEIVDYFYTTKIFDKPSKKIKSKLTILPKKMLFQFNKDFAVKCFSGFSLLVLAK